MFRFSIDKSRKASRGRVLEIVGERALGGKCILGTWFFFDKDHTRQDPEDRQAWLARDGKSRAAGTASGILAEGFQK